MLRGVKFYSLLLFICVLKPEPLFGSFFGGSFFSSLYSALPFSNCRFEECCDKKWIINDFDGLQQDLKTKLHGQHLVGNIVLRALRRHFENENPCKALVLSFHGRTGSGKNHVATMMANRIFQKGMKSKNVKLWIGKLHFKHDSEIPEYKDEIQRTVREMVSRCARSLFIIDEVDYIPHGVIDALKPFLDYHDDVDGVDYRKATFIFLSNTGSSAISEVAYEFWTQNQDRESIEMKQIEPLIKSGSFNEKGGLYKATITRNSLIDFYVPFLPLEKQHVLLCAKDSLEGRGCRNSEVLTQKVTDSMDYEPPELYSKTGCKTVETKITVMFEDECEG